MAHTSVLIVGAGPTGLVLAAQLHRLGVDARVVDKHAAPLELTKAAALHARTLEYLRDLGVVERVLDEGAPVELLVLRTGDRDRVTVDFRTLTGTAYPQMIDIAQYRTEQILIDHLAAAGRPPERNTEVADLRQSPAGVSATLRTSDGEETVTADWVVGCDGVHSTVRTAMGLDFVGGTYADPWVLCDARVDWPLPRAEMTFSGDRDGIFGVFPLPGQSRYRLAYTQTRNAEGALVEPDLADAQAAMTRTGVRGAITDVDQFWTFDLSHEQASAFRRGRAFLVGDAGHVHTPFGGQGLNLGVGDAMNLGWKLAAVITGRAPVALLDSYEAERFAVAEQVVRLTHLGAQAMLLRDDPRHYLRDAAMGVLQAVPALRELGARRLSQLSHSYRGTPAVRGRRFGLAAGDRLPDAAIADGITNTTVRLHDQVSSTRHTLLLTGPGSTTALTELANTLMNAVRQRHGDILDVLIVSTAWDAADTAGGDGPTVLLDRYRDAGRLHHRRTTAHLVRPDRHLGYVGAPDAGSVLGYLAMVATARPSQDNVAVSGPALVGQR